jgi:putative membrane protein
MKRRIATLAFASVLLSTAASAQSTAEKTGVNSTLGIAPKTEDFIKEAAMSDMLEIDAAKIAQQKGDPQEKTFAGEMITDHQDKHRVEGVGVRRDEGRASDLS